MAQVLRQLPSFEHPDFLSRTIPAADAGVFRLTPEIALVQSVDYFTPVVDDPYLFGQIAAANALSDIYAMGGVPTTALNLIGFPPCLEQEVLVRILQGGAERILAAGATLTGGHTVEDDEPKYGLAVTGIVHPDRMVSTRGARTGDRLFLTKKLGTGILATALKGGVISEAAMQEAVEAMVRLNRTASSLMLQHGVHACTDITGFGLIGHALEMAEASGVSLHLITAGIPVYEQVGELAAIGLVPAGSYRNREFFRDRVERFSDLDSVVADILADPQTSGGLLLAFDPEDGERFLEAMDAAAEDVWEIGLVSGVCEGGKLTVG